MIRKNSPQPGVTRTAARIHEYNQMVAKARPLISAVQRAAQAVTAADLPRDNENAASLRQAVFALERHIRAIKPIPHPAARALEMDRNASKYHPADRKAIRNAFGAALKHTLNNAMTPLHGYPELLVLDGVLTDEQAQSMLQAATRLQRLVATFDAGPNPYTCKAALDKHLEAVRYAARTGRVPNRLG